MKHKLFKPIFVIATTALLGLSLSSCSKKELSLASTDQVGEVRIRLQEPSSTKAGASVSKFATLSQKTTFATTPTTTVEARASRMLFTYADPLTGGTYSQTLDFVRVNNSAISLPASVKVGNYNITEFFVYDVNNNVIAMAPKQNSTQANSVTQPLPVPLLVQKDVASTTVIEVVSTANIPVEDFGYPAFRLKEVGTSPFLIAVYTYSGTTSGWTLTNANIKITRLTDNKQFYNQEYPAITNNFNLPYGNGQDLVQIEISKSGYVVTQTVKTMADLSDYYNSQQNGGKGALTIRLGAVDNSSYGRLQSSPGLSARDILTKNPSAQNTSGVYWIDVDGSGSQPAFQTYCDMEHDGGGWMLVSSKFPASALNGGGNANPNQWAGEGNIQNTNGTNNYAGTPTVDLTGDALWSNGRGYTLSGRQLPSDRTQVAFGKNNDATFVGYSNFVYTTGNIASTTVQNLRTMVNATIYRNTTIDYNGQNQATYGCSNGMCGPYSNAFYYVQAGDNITTIPRSTTNSWVFHPNVYGLVSYNGVGASSGRTLFDRGFTMKIMNSNDSTGVSVADNLLNYAWTVWVR